MKTANSNVKQSAKILQFPSRKVVVRGSSRKVRYFGDSALKLAA